MLLKRDRSMVLENISSAVFAYYTSKVDIILYTVVNDYHTMPLNTNISKNTVVFSVLTHKYVVD